MTPLGNTFRIKGIQLAIIILFGMVTGSLTMQAKDFAIEEAFSLRIGQDDLQSLANGVGQELSAESLSATLPGPVAGDLGFARIEASDIEFSFDALSANAEFNGSTGIAASILTTNLAIKVRQLKLNSSGSFSCNNLELRSGEQDMPLHSNVTPDIDGRSVRLITNRVHFELDPNLFQADQPVSCQTPWGFNWLVKKITPWIIETIKQQAAEAVAERVSSLIEMKFQNSDQILTSSINFPYALANNVSSISHFSVWPQDVSVRENQMNLMFGSDVVFVDDLESQLPADTRSSFETKNVPDTGSSWLGMSKKFLLTSLEYANERGVLATTFDKIAAPTLTRLLNAEALRSFLPDASSRYRGHEDLVVSLGHADRVSVIYDPNGPGGIPIIDMVLYNVPVKVKAAGTPYFKASSTVHFRFRPEIDNQTQRLILKFTDADYSVRNFAFERTLCPRPTNQRFDTNAFEKYLKNFTPQVQSSGQSSSFVSLPTVSLGDYSFTWQDIGVVDQYLVLGTNVSVK